uniref:Uncharacterized protein n=1 Tax=Meloidogyne javanica TaxID=6303 RepID=A0A915M342_MELJA
MEGIKGRVSEEGKEVEEGEISTEDIIKEVSFGEFGDGSKSEEEIVGAIKETTFDEYGGGEIEVLEH